MNSEKINLFDFIEKIQKDTGNKANNSYISKEIYKKKNNIKMSDINRIFLSAYGDSSQNNNGDSNISRQASIINNIIIKYHNLFFSPPLTKKDFTKKSLPSTFSILKKIYNHVNTLTNSSKANKDIKILKFAIFTKLYDLKLNISPEGANISQKIHNDLKNSKYNVLILNYLNKDGRSAAGSLNRSDTKRLLKLPTMKKILNLPYNKSLIEYKFNDLFEKVTTNDSKNNFHKDHILAAKYTLANYLIKEKIPRDIAAQVNGIDPSKVLQLNKLQSHFEKQLKNTIYKHFIYY
tara:strand:+ start:1373 stop:2248 length:876 start_codon:yes stop_codon:yes gene_type:complete